MNTNTTYRAMSEIFSQFLAAHPKGPLNECDTLSLGVLAGLVNAQQGNAPLQQWRDIRLLATHAIEILEAWEPELPMGASGSVGGENLQACKNPATARHEDRLIKVSRDAHRLLGVTITKFPPSTVALLKQAVLAPLSLLEEQIQTIEHLAE